MCSVIRNFFLKLIGRSSDRDQATSGASLRVQNMQQFFDSLEYRFVANLAKGADLTFQYDISGEDSLQFYIRIKNGTLEKHLGLAPNATAGIKADSKDYIRIINGDLNANQAYFKGLLKLTGKKMAAQKLRKLILIGSEADKHYAQLKASGKLPSKNTSAATVSGITTQPNNQAITKPTTPEITESLRAPFVLGFKYTRSTGSIIGAALTGFRDQKIIGSKTSDGRVIVPALEYDPLNSAPLSELQEVGQSGTVETWTWINNPRPRHPLQKPFAWALIRLDGAATALLHAVDAGNEAVMKPGLRVKAKWKTDRKGSILDIACFIPEAL